MIENGVVTLPVEEYDKLVSMAMKYSVLRDGLIRNADLSYNGKDLEFDHCPICALLRSIDGHLYSARVFELKREAELDD